MSGEILRLAASDSERHIPSAELACRAAFDSSSSDCPPSRGMGSGVLVGMGDRCFAKATEAQAA